jgi:putative aldouronate transport system permease protein
LALMLNEVQHKRFKSVVQTISYLPHFVSTVVIVGILVNFLSLSTGLINNILAAVGLQRVHFLAEPRYFWPIFTLMNVWRSVGWSSIIYIAALSGIDPTLYEAAVVDGAGRWRQLFCVTLPALLPTIVTLLIMRVGHVLDVGYEAIILMYNPQIYETADVISTYVYRRGLIDADYSFAAAVGLFQSLVGMLMVMGANALSRKLTETSLW